MESRYGGADTPALPAIWRQGFAKACGRGEEQQRTEDRGKDWREAVHEHEQREEPDGSNARIQVAHNGTRDDDTGSTGKALYEAERDERIHRWCDHAQERCERIGGEPDKQWPAAPQRVADR